MQNLSEKAQVVYKHLLQVQKASKEDIEKWVHLKTQEEYVEVVDELVKRGKARKMKGRSGGLELIMPRSQQPSQQGYTQPSDEEENSKLQEVSAEARELYNLVPEDGTLITNKKLQGEFRRKNKSENVPSSEFEEQFYGCRQELLDQHLVERRQCRGGGVVRVHAIVPPEEEIHKLAYVEKEEELYPALAMHLRKRIPELQGDRWQVWICDTSRANIPGWWSRPDVTLVRTRRFEFAPGSDFRVIGYEVKQNSDKDDVKGVYEAASHTARCHECWLVVEATEEESKERPPLELERDLRRFGVGFGWLYRAKDGNYELAEVLEPQPQSSPILKEQNELLEKMHQKLKQEEREAFKTALNSARPP